MHFTLLALLVWLQAASPPVELPPAAAAQLNASLAAARKHAHSLWRDVRPLDSDGLLTGYVEIARGDRHKFEFDIGANAMRLDRMMPESVGGYPVNYGFVPQTISYDGDPFDVLVLGPPLDSGTEVRGAIVGLMQMEDEKGVDSKVVISPLDRAGKTRFALSPDDKRRIGDFFATYKRHEPGKFSRVTGWGTPEHGRAFVQTTHAFFCRALPLGCESGRPSSKRSLAASFVLRECNDSLITLRERPS